MNCLAPPPAAGGGQRPALLLCSQLPDAADQLRASDRATATHSPASKRADKSRAKNLAAVIDNKRRDEK